MTAPPVFLDVESSGIARGSFPIEIGWAWPAPDAARLRARSLLIRPEPAWLAREGAWDPAAVPVHGLTLERLQAEGIGTAEACDVLDAALEGQVVATDTGAGGWDDDWLALLYEAAGRTPRGWAIAEKPSGSHVAQRLRELGLAPTAIRPALKPWLPQHTHAAAEDALAFAWEWAIAAPLAAKLAGRDEATQAEKVDRLSSLLPPTDWPRVDPDGPAFRRRQPA